MIISWSPLPLFVFEDLSLGIFLVFSQHAQPFPMPDMSWWPYCGCSSLVFFQFMRAPPRPLFCKVETSFEVWL